MNAHPDNTFDSPAAAAHDASALERLERELAPVFEGHPPPDAPNFCTGWGRISEIALRARDLLRVHLRLREIDGYRRGLASRVQGWLSADADFLLAFYNPSDAATRTVAGILFPEFREASLWRRVAFRRLQSNLASYVYPDGFQWEQSCDYHWRSVWELQPLEAVLKPHPGFERLRKPWICVALHRRIQRIRLLRAPPPRLSRSLSGQRSEF